MNEAESQINNKYLNQKKTPLRPPKTFKDLLGLISGNSGVFPIEDPQICRTI